MVTNLILCPFLTKNLLKQTHYFISASKNRLFFRLIIQNNYKNRLFFAKDIPKDTYEHEVPLQCEMINE
jgi:hypothetical protein